MSKASPIPPTFTVRDEDDLTYIVTEVPAFSDISTADGYGYYTCEAGPVICIAPGVFEIWVRDEWGPHKVIARTAEEAAHHEYELAHPPEPVVAVVDEPAEKPHGLNEWFHHILRQL